MSKKKLSPKDRDKMERDKKMLMGTGITFFMTLIVVLWFFNVQDVFNSSGLQDQKDRGEFNSLREDLSNTMGDIEEGVKGFKTAATGSVSTESKPKEDIATSSPEKKGKVDPDINDLRRELEKRFK